MQITLLQGSCFLKDWINEGHCPSRTSQFIEDRHTTLLTNSIGYQYMWQKYLLGTQNGPWREAVRTGSGRGSNPGTSWAESWSIHWGSWSRRRVAHSSQKVSMYRGMKSCDVNHLSNCRTLKMQRWRRHVVGRQGGQEQVRKGSVCKVVTLDLFMKTAGNNFTLEFWGNSSGCRVMGECRKDGSRRREDQPTRWETMGSWPNPGRALKSEDTER